MATCKDCLSYEVCNEHWLGTGNVPNVCSEEFLCEHFKDRNRVVELPCKVGNLIDTIIGHNEIVGIWERRKDKEGRYHILLWRGMAWDIPKEYLDRTFLKIFGVIPEKISVSDTVNIAVTPILISTEEAEQALREREKNEAD